MDFQQAVLARLRAAGPVAAMAGTRGYWVTRAQQTGLPAFTLTVVSDPRPGHLKGPDGARDTTVQLDCWADTYAEAVALARACIAAIRPPATVAGKIFGGARVVGQRDLGEPLDAGKFLHRQSVDLIIRHVGD